ncbi:FAD-binding protein [Streptomyces sp. NPDC002004]
MTGPELTTDVPVAGGGSAAAWAAFKAARTGADVVLVDQGYCGTSGATASSDTSCSRPPPRAHRPGTRQHTRRTARRRPSPGPPEHEGTAPPITS